MSTNKIQLCCYCGERPANTKDHVPPKAIFNKPYPSDLITVPCCQQCNLNASIFDEKFKAYLGMQVARFGGEGEKLYKDGALPTLKHNSKLRRTVIENMEPVYITTKSGIITDKAVGVRWDNDTYEYMIDRIVRGLFFHHYKKIISNNAKIKTYWCNKPPIGIEDNLFLNVIGNGAFIYQYNKVDEEDFDSAWYFQFHGGHWGAGLVISNANQDLWL